MTTAHSAVEIVRRAHLAGGMGVDAPDTGTVIERDIARRDTEVIVEAAAAVALALAARAVLDPGDTSAALIQGQKVERS